MPAGMVRPRASQNRPLSHVAKAAYVAAGWTLTAHGNLDAGYWSGPCARCRRPCCRYGPCGTALCSRCAS